MRVSDGKRLNWTTVLSEAVETINETPHEGTRHSLNDVWQQGQDLSEVKEESRTVRMQIQKSFEEARKTMTEQQKKEGSLYPVGWKVWVCDHETFEALDKKFVPFWQGPYEVTKNVSTHIREVCAVIRGKQFECT